MYFSKYIPHMYKKDIFQLDYHKLSIQGIKLLIFDLDNTLALIDQKKVLNSTVDLMKELKKDFEVIVVSNNFKSRIKPICDHFGMSYISFAMKPMSFKIKKEVRKRGYSAHEVCMIGDQLISDILGGNRLKFVTVLVDPLGKQDLPVTKISRYLENIIMNTKNVSSKLKRGNYYDK